MHRLVSVLFAFLISAGSYAADPAPTGDFREVLAMAKNKDPVQHRTGICYLSAPDSQSVSESDAVDALKLLIDAVDETPEIRDCAVGRLLQGWTLMRSHPKIDTLLHEKVLPRLIELLADKKMAAADRLQIARQLYPLAAEAPERQRDFLTHLTTLYEKQKDEDTRDAVMSCLATFPHLPATLIPLLSEGFKSGRAAREEAATQAMAVLDDGPDRLALLTQALGAKAPKVQQLAAEGLVESKDPKALDALLALVQNPKTDATIRRRLWGALLNQRPDDRATLLPIAGKFLNDPDAEVRARSALWVAKESPARQVEATQALKAALQMPKAAAPIAALLRYNDGLRAITPALAEAALREDFPLSSLPDLKEAVYKRGGLPLAAIALFEKELKSKQASRRQRAAVLLCQFGRDSRAGRKELTKARKSDDPSLAHAAEQGLQHACRSISSDN